MHLSKEYARIIKVKAFLSAITEAAIEDYEAEVPLYDTKHNSGERLRTRLKLDDHRTTPRRGDGHHARALYTSVRFLLETEAENES